jgi:hypothetical protein
VALVLWCLALVRRWSLKKTVRRTGDVLTWVAILQLVITLPAWIVNSLRAYLIRALDLAGADTLKWISLFLVTFFVVAVFWRLIEQARLERDVLEGRLNDIDLYVRRVKRGWWPWAAGVVVCIFLGAGSYFLIPEDEPTVDPQIQSLHVTAG